METRGISVAEIRLGLPNTHYCLYWDPQSPPLRPAERRAFRAATRETAYRLDWQVLAAGIDAEGVGRLVFKTADDNLEQGLSVLLRDARDYRIYMVQPVAVLPLATRCIHETRHGNEAGSSTPGITALAEPPEIHYRLFMGERPWAERMLELLTRCARGEPDSPRVAASLADLAASHDSTRDAIADAYRSGRFSLKDIAEHFDMHFSDVSAVLNAVQRNPETAAARKRQDP